METQMVVVPAGQLLDMIETALEKKLNEHSLEKSQAVGEPLYYINQVAKILKKSHATVKKLIRNGLLRTTQDGKLIPQSSIEEFLKSK